MLMDSPPDVADVERVAVGAQRHRVRQLSDGDRVDEALLLDVEDFDAVVAGIGDVDAAARLVEQDVLQAFCAVGLVGIGIDHAALVGLPVVHVHADHVGGMLIASGEDSVTLNGVPVEVPAPVQIFVPGWRTTPERPGSMVKVMFDGARPLDCW